MGRSRAAGVVVVIGMAGCLETNPWFTEPTTTDSGGATTTTGGPTSPTTGATTVEPPIDTTTTSTTTTTGWETDSPVTTETGTTTPLTSTTDTSDGTTAAQPVCGDGIVEGGEECDDGPNNDDVGACTTLCTDAACGDGFVQQGEVCDDKNSDSTDGCVACIIPHSCKEILTYDPQGVTGLHMIDIDGPEPMPLIPVFCDMTLDGGGWTLIERSPSSDPIGTALFKDFPQNQGAPMSPRYRMPRGAMGTLASIAEDMRIDCGGPDHLIAGAQALFDGEDAPPGCDNSGAVLYKEAQFKGYVRANVQLCTLFVGTHDGQCPGAWSIDEEEQWKCDILNYPWSGNNEPVSPPSVDAFAVDPQVADQGHDCHKPGAVRQLMLR